MNIILGIENAEPLMDKFVVLELDSFNLEGTDKTVSAYCSVENLSLEHIHEIDKIVARHECLLEILKNFLHRHLPK
jgi:hypothetical protein